MNLIPLLVAGLLLASCNKSVHAPEPPPIPNTKSGSVQFNIFIDPLLRQEKPMSMNAGIRLSIHQMVVNSAMPVVIWDTLVPVRLLSSYPGPDAPLVIKKPVQWQSANKIFHHVIVQKIYHSYQHIKVDEFSRNIGPEGPEPVIVIGL
jgi:hypothetical protein